MKKKFTFLMAALFALMLITLPGMVKGQTTTINFENYAIPTGWTNSNDMAVVSNPVKTDATGDYCLSTNGKANNSLTSGYIENIVSISVDATRTSNNSTNEVYIDFCPNTSFGNSDTQSQSVTVNKNSWSTSTLTLSNTANGYVRIRRSGGASTATKYIDNIVITCSSGGGSTTYTVTYDANGATSGSVPTDANSPYANGATVTVLGNTGSLAKTGHTFNNWNTLADGTGNSYYAENTFTISSNTTLFAQWTANTHTVTLPEATNEGSYSLSYTYNNSTITSPVAVPYGVKVTLVFTPNSGYEDYEATWSVNNTPIANNGNKFTMPDANVIVTATVAKATSWTYTHAANDGTSAGTGQWTYIDNKFKVKQTKVGNTDIASNQDEIRLYKTHYLEITPSTGFDKVITSVELTCSANDYNFTGATYVAGANSSNTETVTATANNLVYTIDLSSITNCAYLKITAAGQQARITQIKVNYASKYTITYANNLTNGAFAPSGNPATSIAGKNITITTVPVEGYHLATLTYNDGTTTSDATVSGVTGTFTMPEANVIVNATFAQDATYTITYVENGETSFTDYNIPYGAIGGNLPDSPFNTVPVNLEFVGWSTSEIGTYTTTAPDIATEEFNVIDDATFYAVYKYDYSYTTGGGTPNWTKVTDDSTLQAGDQLVIASENAEAVAGDISSQYMTAETADFDGGLTLPDDAVILTLGGEEDDWTLANNSNELLGATNVKKLAWDSNDATNTWSISIENGDATIQNGTDSYGRFMYNVNSPRFTTYTSDVSETMLLPQLYRLEGSSTVSGTYYLTSVTVRTDDATISSAIVWAGNNIIDAEITVANNGKLTVGGLLICPDVDFLTVNDGGQLVVSNSGVKATFKKDIAQTTEKVTDNNHWYAISSPMTITNINEVANLVSSSVSGFKYNLFRYNEADVNWEAYNTSAHPDFTTLENGRGYLYRNNIEDGIEFAGTVNVNNVSINLTASRDDAWNGFNLIGNPFGEDITMDNISGKSFTGGYVLTNAGAWNSTLQTTIHPCQGFLVQVDDDETITISKPAVAKGFTYNHEYLQFVVANDEYEDVTYALFDKGHGLNKINHRNAEIPMVYIPQNGQDYAIAMMNDNVKSFNLNFKAATMGQYTLSYKADGNFNYLHIIDRLTGNDIDMLIEGEYSFIATPNDNENRFIVRLDYLPDYSEDGNEIFAYQNGNDILVSGSGELQIFDVTGRMVMTTMINGAESINLSAKGVYVFRLVGETIKTQKIVVR